MVGFNGEMGSMQGHDSVPSFSGVWGPYGLEIQSPYDTAYFMGNFESIKSWICWTWTFGLGGDVKIGFGRKCEIAGNCMQ